MGCNFLSVTDLLTGANVDCPLWHCVDLEWWSSKVMIAELRPNQSINQKSSELSLSSLLLLLTSLRLFYFKYDYHHYYYHYYSIDSFVHSVNQSLSLHITSSHHHVINSRTQNKENLKKKKKQKIYKIQNKDIQH